MSSLYQYTNQPNIGIQRAWMNQQEEPVMGEVLFFSNKMCFINYLMGLYNK